MTTTNTTKATKATKAQRAAIKLAVQQAALHLVPQEAPGGILEAEAQMDAHDLIRAAIILCTRGNRRDLGERLLAIANELREGARAESAPAPRRKLPQAAQGKRERATLAKAGAVTLGAA